LRAGVKPMSLKIMVVDDEPLTLKVLKTLATPLGHMVMTFSDSQGARHQAEKQRFDLVFLGLPRVDGLELAYQFAETDPSCETVVVMLSATDDVEILRKSFGAGARFFLPKPIAAARVLPILRAMEIPGWRTLRHSARLPFLTDVHYKSADGDLSMRSLNISETGMLLQSLHDVEVGQEVSLEFKIVEFRALLNVRARIVRKEGKDRVAVEFIDLAPEDQNAIQLCVMGRVKHSASALDYANFRSIR
jgi:DNA-binding response OmpR family regulator